MSKVGKKVTIRSINGDGSVIHGVMVREPDRETFIIMIDTEDVQYKSHFRTEAWTIKYEIEPLPQKPYAVIRFKQCDYVKVPNGRYPNQWLNTENGLHYSDGSVLTNSDGEYDVIHQGLDK